MSNGNDETIEAWNTVLFEKFLRFRPFVSGALAVHGTRGIDRLAPPSGARVVDIGCGFGDTSRQLAERVGPEGRVVGIDAAARSIEVARAEAAGIAHLSYEVADAAANVPGGPFDAAFSRMGTMFFASPVFALRTIRKALVPGGKLSMVVWRKKEANEVYYTPELIVREIVGDPPKLDQVTCGPGPFSMASADLVSDQLVAAGYTDIEFMRSDGEMCIGNDVDSAVELALTLGPAGEVMRLAGEIAVTKRLEIEAALRSAFTPFVRDAGVYAATSCWIVTARSKD